MLREISPEAFRPDHRFRPDPSFDPVIPAHIKISACNDVSACTDIPAELRLSTADVQMFTYCAVLFLIGGKPH